MKVRTIGILGGGQLGRMLTQAAKPLGFEVIVVDPTPPPCPAAQVGAQQIYARFDDEEATKKLARKADVITIESEHVNAAALQLLQKQNKVLHPYPQTVALIQDKLQQKNAWKKAGLPSSDFLALSDQSFESVKKRFGTPFMLKARRFAFDGRGNYVIRNKKDWITARKKFKDRSLYAEAYVNFSCELSVLVAKDIQDKLHPYPVVETVHKDNICHLVYSPARVSNDTAKKATALAKKVVKQLDGAGVFAVELFVDNTGNILINEVAPRVHNSGHHTVEGNHTNQFEQHIRAITGLPLGSTSLTAPATVMINILGETEEPMHSSGVHTALTIPHTHVHLYGKTPIKKKRKMGHITVCADTMQTAESRARKARRALKI